MNKTLVPRFLSISLILLTLLAISHFNTGKNMAAEPQQEFYELRIYRIDNIEKQKIVSDYLKNALLPAPSMEPRCSPWAAASSISNSGQLM